MGAKTGIEWTDATWNPIRGCSRVSEGCRHCYAEGIAARFSKPGLAYEGLAVMQNEQPHWTGKIEFVEKHLLDPLKWKPITEYKVLGNPSIRQLKKRGGLALEVTRPRRIFVNSMSDLFHENVTDEMRDKIFAVMALCPQHTFQVLTKRPERMLEYLSTPDRKLLVYSEACEIAGDEWEAGRKSQPEWADFDKLAGFMFRADAPWPLPNVQQGVSVENQDAADDRIESLLRTPAAVRFISAEPLLGPINLGWVGCECDGPDSWDGVIDALRGKTWIEEWDDADGRERTRVDCQTVPKLDWVICGGESGPGARPMHPDWARSLRDQCSAAGVPFFFKQWGEWVPTTDPKIAAARGVPLETCMSYVGKKNAGALLDGVEWKQFPEVKGE